MNLNDLKTSKIEEMCTPSKGLNSYSCNKLPANHKICQNSFIMSLNKIYFARLQDDGNFVVFKSNKFIPLNAIWRSKNDGKGIGPYNLKMQNDGNLVVYDKNNKVMWSTETAKKGKFPFSLFIFENGSLGIIDGENHLIWHAK